MTYEETIAMCANLMTYLMWSDYNKNRTLSEFTEMLEEIFPDLIIRKVLDQVREKLS